MSIQINIFDHPGWKPFAKFGLTHDFFHVDTGAIVETWLALGILISICLAFKLLQNRQNKFIQILYKYLNFFVIMVQDALGRNEGNITIFVAYLFTFILTCNCLSLIPLVEEPTSNINTTLALGTIAVLYVQITAAKNNGLKNYIKSYFEPFFFLFPLNVLGTISTVISLSFRLFGNILGGSIISYLWKYFLGGVVIRETIGLISGINLLTTTYFVVFDGLIQAFVFSMLTVTYIALELQEEE
jgi:F-type H+-transporting ATPase subunit a